MSRLNASEVSSKTAEIIDGRQALRGNAFHSRDTAIQVKRNHNDNNFRKMPFEPRRKHYILCIRTHQNKSIEYCGYRVSTYQPNANTNDQQKWEKKTAIKMEEWFSLECEKLQWKWQWDVMYGVELLFMGWKWQTTDTEMRHKVDLKTTIHHSDSRTVTHFTFSSPDEKHILSVSSHTHTHTRFRK